MDQRRPRLGDIIDDYCPRERRLSNHVVVAMIGDDVRQTRCTTCDADHTYKGGKLPARRKKGDTPAGLTKAVIDASPDRPPVAAEPPDLGVLLRADEAEVPANGHGPRPDAPVEAAPLAAAPAAPPAEDEAPRAEDEGPVHRRLIRATLPRIEGQVPVRQAPDFTLRLPGARLGPLRGMLDQPAPGQPPRPQEPNGNRAPRPHGGKKRGGGNPAFAGQGSRQHAGQGGGRGQGGGHHQHQHPHQHHRHAGGKKRSR
jgi:hypothetical protein